MSKSKKTAPPLASRGNQAAAYVALKDPEETMSDSDKQYKSKIHAVELTLEKLGWDAMPAKIREHLLNHFKLDMTTAHIGVNKTNILRKRGVIAQADGSGTVGRPARGYRRGIDRGNFIAVESFDTVRGLLKDYDGDTILKIGEVINQVGVLQLREIVRLLS